MALAYLFTGPEIGEKDDRVETIKSSLKSKFGEIDVYSYFANETKIEEALFQLQSDSLFSGCSLVIFRNAEVLKKKDEIEKLASWISSESNNVLILISEEYSVDKKLSSLISGGNQQIFWELKEDRKKAWVREYFQKNGFGIEDDAVELILDMVEGNTAALKIECSRFFYCFPQNSVIKVQDVEKILAHNKEENAFTLFDAMTEINLQPAKRFENSLLIIQKILLSKSANATSLIAGLSYCFRKLELWHSIHIGFDGNQIYLDDFALKKHGFTSKKAIAQFTRASQIWTFAQTATIIALLSSTDVETRSNGTTFQETELYLLIYEIVMKNGSRCSKYTSDFEITI